MGSVLDWMRANWGWMLSFCSVLLAGAGWVHNHLRALQRGVQALLRAQMVEAYNRYRAMGYAPLYARESFENCWVQYEKLGRNGVMRDIHTRFLALPTHDEDKEGFA